MKQILWINFAWACLLFSLVGIQIWFTWSVDLRLFPAVLAVIQTSIAFLAIRRKHWAVVLTAVITIIMMCYWVPIVVVNTWMYLTGHALYLDSPATIIIVAIYAIIFAFPATVLSMMYFTKRKDLANTNLR